MLVRLILELVGLHTAHLLVLAHHRLVLAQWTLTHRRPLVAGLPCHFLLRYSKTEVEILFELIKLVNLLLDLDAVDVLA